METGRRFEEVLEKDRESLSRLSFNEFKLVKYGYCLSSVHPSHGLLSK